MAQAPMHTVSQYTAPKGPQEGKALSLLKERTKAELFDAISAQNVLHGGWQKNVEEWYNEKVEKMIARGNDKETAEKLATKQIQKVWANVWRGKLATPGTKQGDGYKNEGDSDGEGAIFLMKKFIFGNKSSFVNYLSHEDIKAHAHSTDLSDKNVLRMFLDGGEVPGFTVESKEGKGLKSPWKQAKVIADHHPHGPTSTTGMVAKLLELTHIIPAKEKKYVEKFVKTIDVVDSFLSKAGKVFDVKKEYAKTLIAFSYSLDSETLYELCTKLPDNVGPFSPIPDDILQSMEVIPKKKKTKVKLQELVEKKQSNIDAGAIMVKEKLDEKKFVTVEGKKFIIFGPNDSIPTDVRAMLSAEYGCGTIAVFKNGDMIIVHDEGIPQSMRNQNLGLIVRDVILVMNANTTNNNHIEKGKQLYSSIPDGEGKNYLMGLLGGEAKEKVEVEAEQAPEEKKAEPVEPKKEISAPLVTPPQATQTPIAPKSEAPVPRPLEKKKIASFAPVAKEMKDEMKKLGKDMKEMWSGFLDIFRRKKK